MILPNRMEVIDRIRQAAGRENYNAKVEVGDAQLDSASRRQLLDGFVAEKKTASYRIKSRVAGKIVDMAARRINRDTIFVGLENLPKRNSGAIITSNHFSPVDTTIPRRLMQLSGSTASKRRFYIVSQDVNLAMKGFLGFLVRYADVVPVGNCHSYMRQYFEPEVKKLLEEGNLLLIYPEEEMWFHYRKPRPPKRGAYYYAAKYQVPIISCFVELRQSDRWDKKPFHRLQYVLHILPPIYPNPARSVQEDSRRMAQMDYQQKICAYEKAYHTPLSYDFEAWDIAGWEQEKPDALQKSVQIRAEID